MEPELEFPLPEQIPFSQVLTALQDLDNPVGGRAILRLSDLEPDEVHALHAVWVTLPDWRRVAMMQEVETLSDDTLLCFEGMASMALNDANPEVRVLALHTLNAYEMPEHIAPMMDRLRNDPSVEVRAAAAFSLGTYVYQGELEEIAEATHHQIQDLLLSTLNSQQDDAVRRAALEAVSFSSREEVAPWIKKAFEHPDRHWKASALVAMGRSADTVWEADVLGMLQSNYPLLRTEAARAAGELELSEAGPALVEMLDDPDENARLAAIWSLSQIGGQGVRRLLERLLKRADNDAEIDFIEEALDNLAFVEGAQLMPIFEMPPAASDNDPDAADDGDWYEEVDPVEADYYDELDDEMDDEPDFDEDDDDDYDELEELAD